MPDGYPADQSLFEAGVLDSRSLVALLSFLEKTFGLKVTAKDMVFNAFDSVNAISAFVTTKLGPA